MGTGHPSFVMSCSFTNQVLAQLDLLKAKEKGYKNDVYLLPKDLDEKVASLHLPALGAQLTTLTKTQADYIGVKVARPCAVRRQQTSTHPAVGVPLPLGFILLPVLVNGSSSAKSSRSRSVMFLNMDPAVDVAL